MPSIDAKITATYRSVTSAEKSGTILARVMATAWWGASLKELMETP